MIKKRDEICPHFIFRINFKVKNVLEKLKLVYKFVKSEIQI